MSRTLQLMLILMMAVSFACSRSENVQPAAAKPAPKPATTKASPVPPTTGTDGGTVVGSPMPAFSALTLDGKPVDLASERGNVVLLNLWATWCGPCRFEIPELQKMNDQHAAQGFKVIGVSLDDSGADAVRKFVSEHKMTYPILLDPEGKLANIFQTSVIPTTVLIDRNGKILWKQFGPIDSTDAVLKKTLDGALAEKKG
jgi:cytochrome c biogenesis protein CcmG/thiol:disulfide interchange protein DsbE